jgi:hypothetical protein
MRAHNCKHISFFTTTAFLNVRYAFHTRIASTCRVTSVPVHSATVSNRILDTISALETQSAVFSTHLKEYKVKVMLSLWQAVKAHRLVKRRGSHILSRQSTNRWR